MCPCFSCSAPPEVAPAAAVLFSDPGGSRGRQKHTPARGRTSRGSGPDQQHYRQRDAAGQPHGAVLALVAVAAVSLFGALLGGLAGMRFHRNVDKAAFRPTDAEPYLR